MKVSKKIYQSKFWYRFERENVQFKYDPMLGRGSPLHSILIFDLEMDFGHSSKSKLFKFYI